MRVTFNFMDETKVIKLWKGMAVKMKKRKRKGHVEKSAVIVLLIICIGLILILGRVLAESSPVSKPYYEEQMQTPVSSEKKMPESVQSEQTKEADLEIPVSQEQSEISSVAETEVYEFTASDKTYFDDALFIGDSRTVGLREYGDLDNADYFATTGLNLYTIEGITVKSEEQQEITLETMLQRKVYGKIYVMLGINELGYDFDTTVTKYKEFIDYLISVQPEAIVYVCANLHVNSLRNEVDEIHNNEAINRINQEIAAMADQRDVFYLDVNPLFDDEDGNLAEEYTSDDSHVLGSCYETWCEWYRENTIIKELED